MQVCQVQQSIMAKNELRGAGSACFLLAQLGSHAAARFAERLKPLGFVPAHAGILRLLVQKPGISQQDLATALNMHASRLVGVIDELEESGMVERRPSPRDRRLYELHLTEKGEKGLADIGRVAREHNQDLLGGLSADQQKQLAELLQRVARHQGLSSGVHPGYRQLREGRSGNAAPTQE
jgi:DNA-binding MarR family transcriptional regulator